MEEGKLLTAGELVLAGELPHRDFEHIYGPGDVYAVAAAFAVAGGPSVAAERTVGLVAIALLVAAVFWLALPYGRTVAAGGGAVAGLVILPFGVHAYSWVVALAITVVAVATAAAALRGGRNPGTDEQTKRPTTAHFAALTGLLAGVALVFRADLLVGVALAGVVLVPALGRRERAWVLVGLLAGLAPYAVHLATAGTWVVVRGMVVDPLVHLRGGRSLPVPPPADRLASWPDAGTPAPDPISWWVNPSRPFELRWFFFLTAAAVIGALVGGAVAARSSRTHRGLLAAAMLALGAVPQMIQRADSVHVRFVACLALALVPAAVTAVTTSRRSRSGRELVGALAVVAVVGSAVAGAPQLLMGRTFDLVDMATGKTPVAVARNAGRSFPVHTSALAHQIEAAIADADRLAGPGGRVFVGPRDLSRTNYSDAFLYHLLPDQRPAGYYLEMNPGLTDRKGSRLARDLRVADVLLLGDRYDTWSEPNSSRRSGDLRVPRVVDHRFRLVSDHGPYRVYVVADDVGGDA